jgi:hypothetical protein
MPEEYLQIAFEIKASCDDISRKLLRWHWEQKPGAHTLDALFDHLEQRRKESPVYYDRLPQQDNKTSWQQLDTTLCMRILLDPEKDATKPLDLLGNTAHPAAARRACNAIRTARNEAAHAADRTGAINAALRFNEAIECLEEGYVGAAFTENDLSRYYRTAEEYLTRCKGETTSNNSDTKPEINVYPTGAAREKAAAARAAASKGTNGKTTRTNTSKAKNEQTANGTGRVNASSARSSTSKTSTANQGKRGSNTASKNKNTTKSSTRKTSGKRTAKQSKTKRRRNNARIQKIFIALAILTLLAGLFVRARGMGYLPF